MSHMISMHSHPEKVMRMKIIIQVLYGGYLCTCHHFQKPTNNVDDNQLLIVKVIKPGKREITMYPQDNVTLFVIFSWTISPIFLQIVNQGCFPGYKDQLNRTKGTMVVLFQEFVMANARLSCEYVYVS